MLVIYAMMRAGAERPSTSQGGEPVDFVAVVDQVLALLRQRGRQNGVHRACNVLSAHGCCTSGVACRA